MNKRIAWKPLVCLLVACAAMEQRSISADELFEKDVRPILKAHCFHCHGEGGEREGGLDVRLRRLLVAGGESGPAVVPGEPLQSLLLRRIRQGEMPPSEDKQLSSDEVETISRWIAAGAQTARPEPESLGDGPLFTAEERAYWAFQPIVRPDVPPVSHGVVRTPVDAFLLQAMGEGAHFQDSARPQILARRAAFDLLGLPADPQLVHEFVRRHPQDPAAWDRLIERLLASPHYGERWGRHWLDVVGYADSEGYTDEDRERPDAFRYRDYVIRSWNADKPFDLFLQEQLAGDELVSGPHDNLSPEAIEKLTATGFLRMAPDGTASSGIEQEVARNQVMADTLQIVGSAVLGMTVHCAQCHDHRYDPIPQSDYYRLRAVFEPALNWKQWKTPPARRVSLYTDADRAEAGRIEAEAADVDAERQTRAEAYITRTLEEELELVPEEVREPLRRAYRMPAADRTEAQTALLKEYPSVANISAGSLYLYDRRREERAGMLDRQRKDELAQALAEVRREGVDSAPAEMRAQLQQALDLDPAKRTDEQRTLLSMHPRLLVTAETLAQFHPEAAERLEQYRVRAQELRASKAADDLKRYTERAAAIRATKPPEGFLRCLIEPPEAPPQTFVFHRGDHEQPRDTVLPGGLSILPGPAEIPDNDEVRPTSGRRLAYARYLTSGKHPLVARVIVNRIWMHHFGVGLVPSVSDFGVLGERPTHPKLLDWLAAEFMDSGWSVKHIHRLIMRSQVYRQASRSQASRSQASPADEPVPYAQFPVRRLEAEAIRDAVLQAAGVLNPQLYGEPVPVREDAVGQIVLGKEMLDGERKPVKGEELGRAEFRRSVYVQVRRSRTLSLFEAFDAPRLSPNCEQRSASTVTLQSLLLMNSDFAQVNAERLADRVLSEEPPGDHPGTVDARRVGRLWQLVFGENPVPEEESGAMQFLAEQRELHAQRDAKLADDDLQRQGLAVLAQALLSSNRFLYVE